MDCVKLSGLKENDMLTWLTVLPLMPIAVLFGRYLMTKIRPSYSLCKLCHWLLKNQELYKNLTNDLSGPMSDVSEPGSNEELLIEDCWSTCVVHAGHEHTAIRCCVGY